MTSPADGKNRAWALGLGLMSLLGICLVGVLVASVGLVFLGLNGMQPVPLHSPLHANYSADPRAIHFPVLNLSVIEEAIRDRVTSTVDPQQQLATVVVALESPVATITLNLTPAAPTKPALATPRPSATPNPPEFTPSAVLTLTPSQTLPSTPTVTWTFSLTPTFTLSPGLPTPTGKATFSPTAPGFPSPTPTQIWKTLTPSPTSTLHPSDTPSNTPTKTLVPSFTPTNTKVPSLTPSPTPTPPPYPPPPTATKPTSYP